MSRKELTIKAIAGPGRRAYGQPGAPMFHRVLRAEPLEVRRALVSIGARFVDVLDPERLGRLELVLAEVLNNIVEHGYPDRPPGLIHVSIVPSGKGLSCAVADDGTALPTECLAPRHDPLTRASMNRPRSEESFLHLPEGGFGWVLIQGLTTNLCHYRENGRNILAFYLGEVDALV